MGLDLRFVLLVPIFAAYASGAGEHLMYLLVFAEMGLSNGTWFRCFAQVPGVGYQGDPTRRLRLAERDDVPQVYHSPIDGNTRISLKWPTPDGATSASPAHRLAFGDYRKETTFQARERLLNALELPGEITDYHFAIQGVIDALYAKRREEPAVLPFVEWFAFLDARLVETHEQYFRLDASVPEYYSIVAFELLPRLFEREGALREALALAERFARFARETNTVSELRARVARLDEELA